MCCVENCPSFMICSVPSLIFPLHFLPVLSCPISISFHHFIRLHSLASHTVPHVYSRSSLSLVSILEFLLFSFLCSLSPLPMSPSPLIPNRSNITPIPYPYPASANLLCCSYMMPIYRDISYLRDFPSLFSDSSSYLFPRLFLHTVSQLIVPMLDMGW